MTVTAATASNAERFIQAGFIKCVPRPNDRFFLAQELPVAKDKSPPSPILALSENFVNCLDVRARLSSSEEREKRDVLWLFQDKPQMDVSSGILDYMDPQGVLQAFLASQIETASWKIVDRSDSRLEIRLHSQTWQGIEWQHDLLIHLPKTEIFPGIVVLEITGGDVNSLDVGRAQIASEALGAPVATLFHIPNQPLWDRVEDDLIAHTLEECLNTSDPTWPLLFPMVQAVQAAMDAIRAHLGPNTRFILTGASKRGWTAWLAGLHLEGVMAIAPRVYDNLNVPEQMAGQLRLWGDYSPKIDDYTRRSLQQTLDSPAGQAMARSIDPYTYLPGNNVPVFIHLGSHDEYWRPDASRFYWNEIEGPKAILVQPNEPHGIGDAAWDKPGLIESLRWLAAEKPLPVVSMELVDDEIVFEIAAPLHKWTAYRSESPTSWFGTSVWQIAGTGDTGRGSIKPASHDQYEGYLIVAETSEGTMFGVPPMIIYKGQDLASDLSHKQ